MWDQKTVDLQCEQTKKLMLAQNARKPEDDDVYISSIRLTPITQDAQCVKEDGTVDLNVRDISTEEYELHEGTRRKAGERLAVMRAEATPATLTDAKRERAEDAFLRKFSLDVIKDKFKSIMKGIFKPSYSEIVADAMRKIK